jgi:hypothetical protein
MGDWVALLQVFMIFIYFRFCLKMRWFHALLIDFVGCMCILFYMVVPAVLLAPPGQSYLVSIGAEPVGFTYFTALECGLIGLSTALLNRFRVGFSFAGTAVISVTSRRGAAAPLILIAAVIVSVLLFPPNVAYLLPYLLSVVSVCLLLMLRWSYTIEMKD